MRRLAAACVHAMQANATAAAQLAEALTAARRAGRSPAAPLPSYGIDDPDDIPAAAEPRSRRRRRLRVRTASLRTLGWLKAVATATVPVVLGGLIVAYLLTRH